MASLAETDNPRRLYGFEYYDANPALSIHLVVEDILKDVELIPRNKK